MSSIFYSERDYDNKLFTQYVISKGLYLSEARTPKKEKLQYL